MKKLTLAAVFGFVSIAFVPMQSYAQQPGVSPLGQNPDLYITIAERQQRQRLFLAGKTNSLFPESTQRGLAKEEDKWFLRKVGKRQNGGKNR